MSPNTPCDPCDLGKRPELALGAPVAPILRRQPTLQVGGLDMPDVPIAPDVTSSLAF
jgi:hypothetical protein